MGSVSPRPDSRGHARHSSEQSRTYHKDRHSRHDSSLAPSNSEDRLQVPSSLEDMHRSFLLEDTGSEDSIGGSAHSNVATMKGASVRASPSSTISESGSSFDELVDRLMAPPVSKADNKFRAIFLALYRKFAAPGRLLEAIVERFDALERDGSPQMNRTTNQLRYLVILQQWVETYPGDFAWPKTKRRMRTFVAKLSLIKIFAAAAKEMAGNLECVHEDADTNWAFCDRDAANGNADERFSIMSSTASLLLDDPTFHLEDFSLGSSYSNDDPSSSAKSNSVSSTASSQSILTFEAAQRQTATLVPNPRYALTKVQWRMLIDLPDDVIAKEMTRIDWLMFCCIKPRDLARQVTQSTAERESCKNQIHSNRMSDHFNNVARWVENYVMLRDKPKHRALMLEKIFRIGRKLRELNNYNSLGALIAGVKSTAIHRLAETRALIPVEVHKDWMKLDLLMSHSRSYFAYRLGWENTHSERIPYMPLLHRDMLSSEVGNKTFFGPEHDGRINWKKLEIQGEVLVTMQKAQGMPYKNLTSSRLSEQVRELLLEVKMMKDDEVRIATTAHRPSMTTRTADVACRKFLSAANNWSPWGAPTAARLPNSDTFSALSGDASPLDTATKCDVDMGPNHCDDVGGRPCRLERSSLEESPSLDDDNNDGGYAQNLPMSICNTLDVNLPKQPTLQMYLANGPRGQSSDVGLRNERRICHTVRERVATRLALSLRLIINYFRCR